MREKQPRGNGESQGNGGNGENGGNGAPKKRKLFGKERAPDHTARIQGSRNQNIQEMSAAERQAAVMARLKANAAGDTQLAKQWQDYLDGRRKNPPA